MFNTVNNEIRMCQWWKNGDHFLDGNCVGWVSGSSREGALVGYYRNPEIAGNSICPHCRQRMHEHGWIDSASFDTAGESGGVVCPGDIIVEVNGVFFPCKPELAYALLETANKNAKKLEENNDNS